MPTIVTHIKPHIDDICAVWLLKRYLPAWRQAEVSFIRVDDLEGTAVDTPDMVHVGVGRGQFDEHKGDHGECAASLVYAHINGLVVLNANERKALDKLVDWVLKEDTGQFLADPNRAFSVPAILENQFLAKGRDSDAVYDLGSSILDALLIGMRNQVELEAIWERRTEFDSAYGKAVALNGNARGAESMAYGRGFDIFARKTDDSGYAEIRARADSEIDLTPMRDKLAKADPGADWFFHHSGKMLICGGDLTGKARLTSLNLEEIIDMLK